MNDILKKVQEEWDKLMGCDIERDDKAGFNAVYRGHQHARDIAIKNAVLKELESYLRPLRTKNKKNYDVVLWRDVVQFLLDMKDETTYK